MDQPTVTPPTLQQVHPPPEGASGVRTAMNAAKGIRPKGATSTTIEKIDTHWMCKRCNAYLGKEAVVSGKARISGGHIYCVQCHAGSSKKSAMRIAIVPVAGLAVFAIVGVLFLRNQRQRATEREAQVSATVASVETALRENRYTDAQMTYQQMATSGDSDVDQRLTAKLKEWESGNFGALGTEEKTYLNTLLRALPGSTPQGKPRVLSLKLHSGHLEASAVASPRADAPLAGGMNVRDKNNDSVQKEGRKIVALLFQMHPELEAVTLNWNEAVDGALRPAGVFSVDRDKLFEFLNEGLSAERVPVMQGGGVAP